VPQREPLIAVRILWIADKAPAPALSGDRVRNLNLIRELVNFGDEVHLLAPLSEESVAGLVEHVKLEYPKRLFLGRLQGPRLVIARGHHLAVGCDSYFIRRFETTNNRIRPDVVVFSQLLLGCANRRLRWPNVVFDSHNCETLRIERRLRETSLPRRLTRALVRRVQRLEASTCGSVRATIACSESDAAYFSTVGHGVVVVPNGANAACRTPLLASRQTVLLFLGSLDYSANVSGILWFIEKVLPLLPEGYDFAVAGSGAPRRLRERLMSHPRVRYMGNVPDAQVALMDAKCLIVPLSQGGGTRLKILEAFAAGTPVVSTSVGVEGISAINGEHLLVADDPADFARAIVDTCRNEAATMQRMAAARALVTARHSWPILAGQFRAVLGAAAGCQKR
jgi:glycosyltransferase involved in cell wall biosynthesis